MSGVTATIMNSYTNWMDSHTDPRTIDWFLVGSPASLFTILVTYVYFCKYAGPQYMRDRKPFDLKNVIIFYNAFQVFLSAYLVYEGLSAGWLTYYSFKCQPVDYSDNPLAMRMARGVWLYYMTKLIELLDTVFFVLRKKTNQVSYLHVYHHTIMPFAAWIGITFLPNGHATLLGVINAFIHIIMYTYYLVSSLGPQYQKYLWWKRHLTSLQMIQFMIIFVHNFQPLFIPSCGFPKFINFLLATQAAYFLYLFGKFYYHSYVKQKGAKKEHADKNGFKYVTNNNCNGRKID